MGETAVGGLGSNQCIQEATPMSKISDEKHLRLRWHAGHEAMEMVRMARDMPPSWNLAAELRSSLGLRRAVK